MKQQLLLLILIVCFSATTISKMQAKQRTVHVATAGTLSNYISDSEKYTIDELILTGKLNGTDFRLLRDMCGNNYLGEMTEGKLKVLDMTNARIVAGGVEYFNTSTLQTKNGNQTFTSAKIRYTSDDSFSNYLFAGCYVVEKIFVPNSVTSIGFGAVAFCSNLTSLPIPSSVTSIGNSAFYYCSNLTSLLIPNNVTSIGNYAFYYCSGLNSITIPNSLTNIGDCCFSGCSALTSISVEAGNTMYDSRNNCNAIIRKSDNSLIAGCKNTIIPKNISSIGIGAFEGINLTSVDLPYSLISIGDYAFCGCKVLTSIAIPKNVTSIGTGAFYGCNKLVTVKADMPSPVFVDRNTFTNRAIATLYVPKGSKTAYENADFWKEFMKIEEINTPNMLSLDTIEGYRGNQVVLPIAMENQHQITGLQCDLYLPAGVTVAKKSNGKMMISTTDRMEGDYTLTSEAMNGFIRIVGYSGESDAFTGNSGDILNVTLNLNGDMEGGDYTISLKDIVLSDVNNIEYHPADVETILKVNSYRLGDVDDSGAVNINDVVCIINYILNRANGTFIPEAADVDENGTININDVVTLINRYILMKDSAPAQMRVSQRASIEDNNYLHLVDIDMNPGETKEVQLMMTNAGMVAASQGNIKLPAGLSFVTKSNGRPDVKNIDTRSEDFTLSCALQDDGSMTFAQYSADGFAYTGNEGGIFTFKVKAAEDAVPGTYSVALTGVVLSINGVGYDIPDRTSSLTISETSGIDGFSLDDTKNDGKYYSLDGRMLQGKPILKGIYLNNGKKVVVK